MGLTLVRHTTPDIAPGVCYGRTDLDVTSQFPEEAAAVAAALPSFRRIVTSPLSRCRKLANFLSLRCDVPFREASGLIEMDFGRWERRAWADIPRAELDAWAADFLHARPHGGESVSMLRARVHETLSDIGAEWQRTGEPTLIITHSGVIRTALAKGNTAADFDVNVDFGGFVTLSSEQGTIP
ncbi:MAG: alpha-ribazole phosphatase family protein [Pseudomonadota bacterium]